MIKRLIAAVALLCAFTASAQNFQPIVQPHQTFVDGAGSPCSQCLLYSYQAGTSTPTPTYTDSTGLGQNTNPITLDSAGGASVWLASGTAYKFVLNAVDGTTIWTVDNVTGGLLLNNFYLPLTGGTLTGALNGTTATFSGAVAGSVFNGAGTGLTGTAAGLSIGGTAANLAAGALGSSPYQSAAGTTTFLASPTTSGHTFVYSWQPAGSAIAPSALDLGTYLASPPAIGGSAPAAGTFTTLQANTSIVVNGSQAITGVQGTTGTKLAAATGSFTNGNLRATDANGNEVDAAVPVPPTFSGGSSYTFPGGLIIKTGLADSASSTFAVTFSPAFPNAVLSVAFGTGNFGTNASRNVCYIDASGPTTSGFTAKTDSTTVHCYWTAIGW